MFRIFFIYSRSSVVFVTISNCPGHRYGLHNIKSRDLSGCHISVYENCYYVT